MNEKPQKWHIYVLAFRSKRQNENYGDTVAKLAILAWRYLHLLKYKKTEFF